MLYTTIHAYHTYPEVNRLTASSIHFYTCGPSSTSRSATYFSDILIQLSIDFFETPIHSSFLVPIDLERSFSSHSLTLEIKSGVPMIYILQDESWPASPLIWLRDARRKNWSPHANHCLSCTCILPLINLVREKAPPQFRWRVFELGCYGPQEPEGHSEIWLLDCRWYWFTSGKYLGESVDISWKSFLLATEGKMTHR